MTDLLEHVDQSIRDRNLFRRGQRILVAVSGGVDSMVLLDALHRLAPSRQWKLTVAHFNHQLRGRSSDADERLVRKTAAALKLPFIAGRSDVKRHAKAHGLSLEMAGRELRHKFLARTARNRDIPTIALAHHADDQVELFFLRALRGAGGEGLAGMKWVSPSPSDTRITLARPLLDVGKSDLLVFARRKRIRFRDDASNASPDFLRNRVRHELLPLLRHRLQPALGKTILRSMDILGAETEVVKIAARGWLEKRRPTFARLPVAVQRRALQLQLLNRRIPVDFEAIELLREHPDQPMSLSPLISVSRDVAGRVQTRTLRPVAFNSGRLAVALTGKPGRAILGGARFRWRFDTARRRSASRPNRCECFDADRVGPRIRLRHWQPGDRFQPIGMSRSMKLQDWFTNRRIPRTQRHELVVAESAGGEIFWIEGQRISENFKLTPQTKRRLVWRWNRSNRINKSQSHGRCTGCRVAD